MIRILITTGIFPPDIGGPATMLESLISSLKERPVFVKTTADKGFDIKILTYSDVSARDDKIYRIKRRKNFLWQYLEYFLKMWKLAKWADIIYATDTYSVGYFAYLMKKILRKKYVIRFAGDSAWETAVSRRWTKDYIIDFQRNIYGRQIEKLKERRKKILINADAVIAVSNFMARLAGKIGVNQQNIRLIYNSIDFIKNGIDKEKIEQIKNKYGQAPRSGSGQGVKIIVTACRLMPWKGVDGIIKILPELKQKAGDINLLVLGDGPELENLKNLADNLNLNNAHFLGRIKHNELLNYFKAADLFILNTNYEGLSHTLLEAMKAGAPIISTNVGGNPEVIENNRDGLLIHYNNYEELSSAAIRILNNPQFAETLAANAKRKLEKFNWDNAVNQTAELLKEIYSKNDPSTNSGSY